MKFYTINDYKLSMECLTSWRGRSLESIERVGPAKAELIKKAFLHFFWLIWLCGETKNFLTELKDSKGIAMDGFFLSSSVQTWRGGRIEYHLNLAALGTMEVEGSHQCR